MAEFGGRRSGAAFRIDRDQRQAVAEQIGAQIFIDGWAMAAPGKPKLAARLAEAAGSVSHDGESVHAAKLLAAMEAEAFVSSDIDHLLDVGLSVIPGNSLIAALVRPTSRMARRNCPTGATRGRRSRTNTDTTNIPGNCHVVPNHALIHLALLYAPRDFHTAMTIVNTAGWDTDCNSGNVGCLLGMMLGLQGLEGGPDWRGPLADRTLVSASDGGYAVNDAVRIAYDIANLGRQLGGLEPEPAPKDGAQFHFSLPGSVQGFMAESDKVQTDLLRVEHGRLCRRGQRSRCKFQGLARGRSAAAMTPMFTPPNVAEMRTYDLQASPQTLSGPERSRRVDRRQGQHGAVRESIRIKVYGRDDQLFRFDGPVASLTPARAEIEWTIPDLDGQPIQKIGLALAAPDATGGWNVVWLDSLRMDGAPQCEASSTQGAQRFWRQAWVNNVSFFSKNFASAFRISQDRGSGLIICGTREWTDYRVSSAMTVHLGPSAGLAARVQGLRRYYAILLESKDRVRLVKVRDDERTILAEAAFAWSLEKAYDFSMEVRGREIVARVDGVGLKASDDAAPFEDGGIGLIIAEGSASTDLVEVAPVA